jgi:probable phosphoglycerate mutase
VSEPELVLVRHAETAWSLAGRHTGRSDVPLTDRGRRAAVEIGRALQRRTFARVLTSPLSRARETCALAGFGIQADVCEALLEWDYGAYEGRTTKEIRAERPDWDLFGDGCPGGETVTAIGARADAAIAEALTGGGDVALFAHGHLLRVLGARWVGLGPEGGAVLALAPASISVLGHERVRRVIASWNHVVGE